MEAVNRIDDFFEYRYKNYSKEEIKSIVMDIIDNITKEFKGINLPKPIDCFHGDFYFLSNFYPGDESSLEHKYQAAKCDRESEAEEIYRCEKPGKAKRLGRNVHLRPRWDKIKEDVMLDLLRAKFNDISLAEKLIETADRPLIEGNNWHDNYWGNCDCVGCASIEGQNVLGKLLEKVRKECLGKLFE